MTITSIEWTDRSWNPTSGCTKVSPGCRSCYAETLSRRNMGMWAGRDFTDVRTHADKLDAPLRWRKPARVFVNSMSDLFHEDVPDDFIRAVFVTMYRAPKHTFQILTKRPQRMRDLLTRWARAGLTWHGGSKVIPHVWLGVSVEDQPRADERIPILLDTPAAVRFVSCEPMLGPVDFGIDDPHAGHESDDVHGYPHPRICLTCSTDESEVEFFRRESGGGGIDWVIFGGESGHGARPCNVDWIRDGVRQCREAGVAAFVKQLGANVWEPNESHHQYAPCRAHLSRPKGNDPAEWPEDLRVREFPS